MYAIRSYYGGVRAEQERRRHGKAGAHHAADHHLEVRRLRRLDHRDRFGQAAGLVELDVNHVVELGEARDVLHRVRRLVGAQRDRRGNPGEEIVLPRGQRLLDHRDAEVGERPEGRLQLRP